MGGGCEGERRGRRRARCRLLCLWGLRGVSVFAGVGRKGGDVRSMSGWVLLKIIVRVGGLASCNWSGDWQSY
jgi:hypothetical protein